jgi:hypothetical protein
VLTDASFALPPFSQGFAAAFAAGITKTQLDSVVGIHPTSAGMSTIGKPVPLTASNGKEHHKRASLL